MFSLLNLHDPEVHEAVQRLIEVSRRHSRMENDRISAVEDQLELIRELLMPLSAAVQALVDQDAQLKDAVNAMVVALGDASSKIADLQAKVAAAAAAPSISADDIAAIQSVTNDIASSVSAAHAAVSSPAPAAPAGPTGALGDTGPVGLEGPAAVEPADAPADAPASEAAPAPADAPAASAEAPAAPSTAPDPSTPGAV